MTSIQLIELEATDIRFFSELDEVAFFDWLGKLSCIQKNEGRGNKLYITVNSAIVDEDDLRELLALFHRYGIAMRQLEVFNRPEFAEWFHNKEAYWYITVFDPISSG